MHLARGIIGGNAKYYGEVRFEEEGLKVVYCGYAQVGSGKKIISYIANRCRKVINNSLEINDPIYLYWCFSQFLGINIR